MSRLGKIIRKRRHDLGFSVRGFATALGKTPGYISRVETRKEIPSADLMCEIAEQLKLDPEVLFSAAKQDTLKQAEKHLDEKYRKALSLYRKAR